MPTDAWIYPRVTLTKHAYVNLTVGPYGTDLVIVRTWPSSGYTTRHYYDNPSPASIRRVSVCLNSAGAVFIPWTSGLVGWHGSATAPERSPDR